MTFLRKVFKYHKSEALRIFGSSILRILPLSWVTIKTRYGLVLKPKDFRVFTMMLDMVEPEIQKYFEDWVRVADVFVDVGASIGWYILKAHKLNPSCSKVAIEPDAVSYAVLKANFMINGVYTGGLKAVNIACSDKSEQIEIATCVPSPIRKAWAQPLDLILADLKTQLTKRSLILIDVEGAGYNVLMGAIHTLTELKPRIVIELHKGEEEVERLLTEFGYIVEKPSEYFLAAYTLL